MHLFTRRKNVVWDKNYSSNSAFAHGILLLQNKLLLIGSIGPIDIGGGTNTMYYGAFN
jgi:hypothetical protein